MRPLIEQFLCRIALFQQRLGTLQLLRGQCLLRALQLQIGVGFLDRALGLLDLRLRFLERLLKIPGVHARDHLPRAHHVTDLGVQFRDPARKFRVDVDLVGLQPAIAVAYACEKLRLRLLPPIEAAAACGQKDGNKPDREPQPPRIPGAHKRHGDW